MAGKTKRQKGNQRKGVCAYCGQIAPMTQDHVFAQTLFRERRGHPIKIDVCQPCHTNKNRGEGSLRDVAYFSDGGVDHPDAEFHLARTARSTMRGSSLLGNSFRNQGRDSYIINQTTRRVIKPVHAVPTDVELERLVEVTVSYIIRGLYVHETGGIMNPACPIVVERLDQLTVPRVLHDLWRTSSPTSSGVEGTRVARWDSWRSPFDPESGTWIICLAEAAHFQAWTGTEAIQRTALSVYRT